MRVVDNSLSTAGFRAMAFRAKASLVAIALLNLVLVAAVVAETGLAAGFDTPMTAAWSGIGLRDWAARVGEAAELPVLVDRRLDPDTPIRLACREEPLRDVIARVAHVARGESAILRTSAWIVPPGRAAVVRRAEQARESRLATLPARHRSVLARKSRCAWAAGARPRDLLVEIASQAGIALEGVDRVPHDHLSPQSLPELTLAERLDLLLMPFDLRVEWHAAGATMKQPPTGSIIAIDTDLPAVEDTPTDGTASAARPPAAGKAPRRPPREGPKRDGGRHTFSLQVVAPLDELLAACSMRLNVKLDLDRESLVRRGIAPGEIVRMTVKDASRDELLDAILGPLDLSWTINDDTLRVFAP